MPFSIPFHCVCSEGTGEPPADAVQFKVGVQRVLKSIGGVMSSAHMLHIIHYDAKTRAAVLR